MIAEIRYKASRKSRQSEDVLTSIFFGVLRYLPFEYGLKPILNSITFDDKETNKELLLGNMVEGHPRKYEFWKRMTGISGEENKDLNKKMDNSRGNYFTTIRLLTH